MRCVCFSMQPVGSEGGEYPFLCLCVFFFKQKTAYEMRISDWSSDVCSSDLGDERRQPRAGRALRVEHQPQFRGLAGDRRPHPPDESRDGRGEIGRASCRERVCKYVSILGVGVSLKKKTKEVYRQ